MRFNKFQKPDSATPPSSAPPPISKPPTRQMLCPRCVRWVDDFDVADAADGSPIRQCPECENDVPHLYVRDYDTFSPAVFSLIGYRAHGKSVFLGSLFHQMEEATRISAVNAWPGFSYADLDPDASNAVREIERGLRERELPPPTDSAFDTPAILQMHGMPQFGNRHLIAFDTSGELLQDVSELRTYSNGFISRVKTVVLFVSWMRKEEPSDSNLNTLFSRYRDALASLKGDSREQSLLVVLSKGDRLLGQAGLPDVVSNFLKPSSEVLTKQNEMHENGDGRHLQRLDELSQEIEMWLEDQAEYANFVQVARNEFKRVEYCVATSVGHEPNVKNNPPTLDHDLAPRGVLSVLLWTLRLETRNAKEEVAHNQLVQLFKEYLNTDATLLNLCRKTPRKEMERLKALRALEARRGRTLRARKLREECQKRRPA